MGEIADGLINGDFDFYTGEYLGRGGGYPRTGNKSLPWERGRGFAKNHKSGVTKWLVRNGIEDKQEQMKLIKAFVKDSTDNDSKEQLCLKISCDWGNFKKWFFENTQPL